MRKKILNRTSKKLTQRSVSKKNPGLKLKLPKRISYEGVSQRSPPSISSKSRQKEIDLEKDIKSRMNLKKHPELEHISYKTWIFRAKTNKSSYLDTLYAKNLARHYDESTDSANGSKILLQSLTKTLEKVLSPPSQSKIESFHHTNPKTETKAVLHPRLRKAEELSTKLFSKTFLINQELNEAVEKLEKIRLNISKTK